MLEENKELQTGSTAEEPTPDTNTENIEEAIGNSILTATEAFEEKLTEDSPVETSAEDAAVPQKKKGVLQLPIIIGCVIVGIAIVAALVLVLFFNKGIAGTWHYVRTVNVMANEATSDEVTALDVDYYFDFHNDGTVNSTIGTVTSSGTYETYKNDDGQTVITVNLTDTLTSSSFLDGEYLLNVSGNAFAGRKLTLTSTQSEDSVYEFTSEKYKAPEITREGDFTPNEKIVGTWVYTEEPYNLTYEFSKDGKATYREKAITINPYTYSYMDIDITMNGIYDCTDDTITMTYYFTKESTMEIAYSVKDDVLYINDYPFVREGAATAD